MFLLSWNTGFLSRFCKKIFRILPGRSRSCKARDPTRRRHPDNPYIRTPLSRGLRTLLLSKHRIRSADTALRAGIVRRRSPDAAAAWTSGLPSLSGSRVETCWSREWQVRETIATAVPLDGRLRRSRTWSMWTAKSEASIGRPWILSSELLCKMRRSFWTATAVLQASCALPRLRLGRVGRRARITCPIAVKDRSSRTLDHKHSHLMHLTVQPSSKSMK
jgi:hypothetical protein